MLLHLHLVTYMHMSNRISNIVFKYNSSQCDGNHKILVTMFLMMTEFEPHKVSTL